MKARILMPRTLAGIQCGRAWVIWTAEPPDTGTYHSQPGLPSVQIGGSLRRGEDEDLITRRQLKRLADGSGSRRRLGELRWLM
jgi:hypothetical protein